MSPELLAKAQLAVGHHFSDPGILELALTHASVSDSRLKSNERLEFLGDAVLGLVICRDLFDRFPDLLEGEMTKIKSAAVSRQTCATVAFSLDLHNMLTLGKGMKSGNQQVPSSLAAGVLEAIIAAIYIDGGFEAASRFIRTHFGPMIDAAAMSGHHENFKSVLQQHAQQHFNSVPIYKMLDEQGPDHAKCFKVGVEIGGRKFNSTWAPNKKRAEQLAALEALRELGLLEIINDTVIRIKPEATSPSLPASSVSSDPASVPPLPPEEA